MELRHCRYFVAVAEELHFGRAAKRLGISQPPLSQQIRGLETELGVELLRRTKRVVRLTPAGEVFLEAARKLLRGAEDSVDVARRTARGEVGTLQIGYAPGLEIEILPRILRRFSRSFPNVHARFSSLPSRHQVEALHQRRIDVGLVLLPAPGEGLQVLPLKREPLVLAAQASHPLARRGRVRIHDLQGLPFVHLERAHEPLYHDHVMTLARDARVTFRIAAESAHLYDSLSLVAAGVGVAILPAFVRRIRRTGVAYRPLLAGAAEIEAGLVSRKNELSRVPLAFLDIARRAYPRAGRRVR